MDEAKTLVHMSISAMFAAMFIAVAVGLISVGYMMWSYFSRQDAADRQMSNYANYTAFDNTVVRGQEVLQLIESNDDIFVVVVNGDDSSSMEYLEVDTSTKVYTYIPYDYMFDIDFTKLDTTNSCTACSSALEWLKGTSKLNSLKPLDAAYDLCNYTHSQLVSLFTHSTTLNITVNGGSTTSIPGLGAVKEDENGNPLESGAYSKFISTLVYDESSADIVGIILMRPTAETD